MLVALAGVYHDDALSGSYQAMTLRSRARTAAK
jgi:hypothetical protein